MFHMPLLSSSTVFTNSSIQSGPDVPVHAQPAAGRRNRPILSQFCRKTKMCAFYLRGTCRRGANCSYAHDPSEIQAVPDLSCTKICPDVVKSGHCPKGVACKFAHSETDLRRFGIAEYEALTPSTKECTPSSTPAQAKATASKTMSRVATDLTVVAASGALTQSEMVHHLIGIFKAMLLLRPEVEQRLCVTAEELAFATAQQAWADAGVPSDARLKFEDVVRWCSMGASPSPVFESLRAAAHKLESPERAQTPDETCLEEPKASSDSDVAKPRRGVCQSSYGNMLPDFQADIPVAPYSRASSVPRSLRLASYPRLTAELLQRIPEMPKFPMGLRL